VRKLLSAMVCGAMAVSFSQLAAAQYSTSGKSDRDNIHYNIHQRGDQSTSQIGDQNQSSQISGDSNQVTQQSGDSNTSATLGTGNTATVQGGTDNTSSATTQSGAGNTAGGTVAQSGTQNQSAIGTGNQQSQQSGSNLSSNQASTLGSENVQNRQYGMERSEEARESHNKGKHKGWDNTPQSSDSSSSSDTRRN